MPAAKRELFTGRLVDKFRFVGSWVSNLNDESRWVGNDTIRLVDIGADPNVLIDNTTYPIPVTALDESDIAISLHKFDTENTPITDDELYAITFNKIDNVVDRHNGTLEETTAQHGLHSIAPASDLVATPVVETTGADDGTNRKRMQIQDIITLKRKFDDNKIPKQGRHLVLCNEHIEDLLLTSEAFRNQYTNIREGRVLKMYGFNIHEDVYCPRFSRITKVKVAFGAAPAGTDGNASIAYYQGDCFRARGSVMMYYRQAEIDPENRRNVVGFRIYHLILPYKRRSQGAILSMNAV